MKFKETKIQGAWLIEPDIKADERGFFARGFCEEEFREQGISFNIRQANIAHNRFKNTLRGLHYQIEPHAEKKLVRCVRGAIYDVIADVRPGSPTYQQWTGVELSSENYAMLLVPEGCAHGYQTLFDDTEVHYMVSALYAPESERGIQWDDPAFNIRWRNGGDPIISEKDTKWPEFSI